MFEINKIHLADCMDLMAYIKVQQEAGNPVFDKRRILAILDPPFGLGESLEKDRTRKKHKKRVNRKPKAWDLERPSEAFFDSLYAVSENQIIWGGNYFTQYLPPSMGWIYWDKMIGGDFSDGELAFTSFKRALKSVQCWSGNNKRPKIHPNEKPEPLMTWLLDNYAKPGDLILDTHSGSGSVARACVKRGFDFIASELDPDYHRDSLKLLAEAKAGLIPRTPDELKATGAQPSLFD